MSKIQDFLDALVAGAKPLVIQFGQTAVDDIKNDLEALKADSVTKIETWTKAYENGDLTEDDLKSLIEGEIALYKLAVLTNAGITQSDAERLRKSLIDLVFDTAVAVFL